LLLCVLSFGAWGALDARAQEEAVDGMIIRRVEVRGLEAIGEGFVRRIIKTRAGQTYTRRQVQDDVRELWRTRKFLNVFADTAVEEGEVVVTFRFQERPEILSVEIEGNKRFSDEELFRELAFTAGSVLDMFEINRGLENILRKYKEKGYYYAEVKLDERALAAEARVIYRITEGPRVKVRKILFEGARSFPIPRLRLMVRTQTYWWILRAGAFDEEQADRDALELQTFYRNEGFLDARVGYRLEFDTVSRENLTVVFVIEEGLRYRVEDFRIRGNEAFSDERIRAVMQLEPGDVLRDEALRADVKRIEDLYGGIGYVAARIDTSYDFLEEPGVVRLNVDVTEGVRSRFGRITIRGNTRTKDKVIRRELRFYPGEDYDAVETRRAERRLMDTALFNRATITPLDDVGGFREALVEVEEAETVNFLIGVGVSTDSGVLGSLTIDNRNFDLFDWPRTWGEFFRGQAFRGAGQRLRFQAEPGSELSRFRIDFTEPYLFDKPLRYDFSVYLFQRSRDSYDEQRLGFTTALSKRFETGPLADWAIEGALRVEGVELDNLRPLAARDIRDAKGSSFLTSLKATIVRDTTDSRFFPTEGYRFALGWEQVGALGGDEDFGKPFASFAWYKTTRTDIFDRKSVFATRADVGYIVGDAPVFERFYGGGFGSIRGFDYQGVSPRAGLFNDRVGGKFIVLTGAEYSVPIYAKNIRGVTFIDMGTVEEDFGITSWRVAVGFGLRVHINFFGPVPMVFDFGFPIAKGDLDDTRVFNFSFGASF
jgi:outer membrane protein insertion porin family